MKYIISRYVFLFVQKVLMSWFSKIMVLWCEVKHTYKNSNRIQLLTDKNGLKWGRTSFLSKQVILSDNRYINRTTIHQ